MVQWTILNREGGGTMSKGPVIGLCAHVDAGKTTLSESMLFLSGALRRQGRVDHGDERTAELPSFQRKPASPGTIQT